MGLRHWRRRAWRLWSIYFSSELFTLQAIISDDWQWCTHGNSEVYFQKWGNTLRLEQRITLVGDEFQMA
jgi:hypothetical protein